MAVISIIGTSGVGKSFLVSQLASLNGMPAFLEGEEGVIPHEMFSNIFEGKPRSRYEYFVERYRAHLTRARTISDCGLDAYVDGASISPEAIMRVESLQDQETLRPIVETLRGLHSDLTVLLTASPDWLSKAIAKRNRGSEQHEQALTRALSVQESYISLLREAPNTLQIERSAMDFAHEDELRAIDSHIHSACE
jgi:deoxyadenosine/deoxycytidine kinase